MLPFQLLLLGFVQLALSSQPPTYPHDGSDLLSFVSVRQTHLPDRILRLIPYHQRPDIRAPRFNLSIQKPELVTPGYWFTAPYGDLRSRLPTTLYQPGQVGPHIYDNNGDLVWSGAHLFDDRPTFDFKVVDIDSAQHLTFITNEDLHETDSPGGSAIILDNTYQRVREVEDKAGRGTMNMHEYNTIDGGRRALTITFESKLADLVVDGQTQRRFIGNNGFSEIDTTTGEPVFTWWAMDHVDPTESLVEKPTGPGSYGSPWDAYHINSVDTNEDGDYLVSARYTSTIYKISGKDGKIIWRLGGSKSDFALEGFNMSSQHDAHFESDNETTTVITFFNNHSDGHHATANTSAAMEVALDLTTMKAHVLSQWDRPDGGLTKLRGNAQRLPNGNMFVCWSENSYMSEHTPEGELIMEAQMASHRLVSYRAYKMDFNAQPSEPIALKEFVFGIDEASSTTVMYVSWNGATEVAQWRLYSKLGDQLKHIGIADRTGFETMFMAVGAHHQVLAEAVDAEGSSLGMSEVSTAELPSSWNAETTSIKAGTPSTTDLDGTSAEMGEQTSVSEDLSTHLHHAAQQEDREHSDEFYFGGVAWTNPTVLSAVGAVLVFVTGILMLRRARRNRLRRPEMDLYKTIEDEV